MDYLNDPWVITIVGGVIVSGSGYYLWGRKGKSKKRVGIVNSGKNNIFTSNSFSGLDVGIDDRGQNTKADSNSFK
ncbi:MAG: hypothetical protein Q7T74_02070 [Candidatus Saccharibacteria bacterium]|nr:hypothetical protein [Candidatus Saccharibacteria bacterium]